MMNSFRISSPGNHYCYIRADGGYLYFFIVIICIELIGSLIEPKEKDSILASILGHARTFSYDE